MLIDTTEFTRVTVPKPIPLEVPTFDTLQPPDAPNQLLAPVTPYVWQAYGTMIQDYIDGRIADFSAYFSPLEVVFQELKLARVEVMRKYHKARQEFLAAEGKKNPMGMPGHVLRKLTELSIDERREMSEAGLKIAANHADRTLDNISAGIASGLQSDAIRFDSHHKMQAANFEVAQAVIDGALKAAAANIEMYNETLRLIDLEWESVKQKLQYQEQQVAAYAAEIKAVGVVVENEAVYNGLLSIAAELQAISAKRAALEYEINLLNAQILRNSAELEVARAEQLLANAKSVTASMEIDKAQARAGLAAVEFAKNTARVQRNAAETERVRANAEMDAAELHLSVKEKELQLIHDRFEVTRKQFEAQMTTVKQRIPEVDKLISELRVDNIQRVSEAQNEKVAEISFARFMAIVNRASSRYDRLASTRASINAQEKIAISQEAELEVKALIEAAQNSADSRVKSIFIKRRGEGVAP